MPRQSETTTIPTSWLVGGVSICATVVGLFVFLSYWFQPPVVAISNLKYLQLLRTAVSSQNPDHVNKVNIALATLKERGEVSDLEWEHFQSIIAKALDGNWQAAEQACQKWENAQSNRLRPPEDQQDLSAHGHSHSHKRPAGK